MLLTVEAVDGSVVEIHLDSEGRHSLVRALTRSKQGDHDHLMTLLGAAMCSVKRKRLPRASRGGGPLAVEKGNGAFFRSVGEPKAGRQARRPPEECVMGEHARTGARPHDGRPDSLGELSTPPCGMRSSLPWTRS
jgi:hypothetical protein